jgi:hypothetical protein
MGLKDDTVYSIAGGAEDEVWVARKYGGVTRFRLQGDALQASTYTRRSELAQDAVASIYRAADAPFGPGHLMRASAASTAPNGAHSRPKTGYLQTESR